MASVDKEEKNLQRKRKPLQLMSIKNGSLELNSETLKILQSQIRENNQVAIVGIAGSPKSGKSLLANYLIEYFENHHNPGHNWLKTWEQAKDLKYLEKNEQGGDKFEHFPVAGRGPILSVPDDRLPPGVYCWVIQPCVEKGANQSLSILVLDIQSPLVDDALSRLNIYGALVDFVFFASSLVIYLDTLENWEYKQNNDLKFWSPASSFVKKAPEKYFQNCHYMLRGWNNPKDFIFGSSGGSKFLIAHKTDEKSPFHEKSQEIESYLQSQFMSFKFHLLPHSKAEFSRILKEGSKEYINYLNSFAKIDLDVEEIFPARFNDSNNSPVIMSTLETFLKYPLNIITALPEEINVPLPIDKEISDISSAVTFLPKYPVKVQEHLPPTHIFENSTSNPVQALESSNKQERLYPDLSEFHSVRQCEEPMEVDEPLEVEARQEPINCPAIEHTKTTQEKAALDMLEDLFKPHLEILQSSKYFIYQNVKEEVDKMKKKLTNAFPTFLTPENKPVKVEIEFRKKSTKMQKLNNESNKRRMEAENQMTKLVDSLQKSEFQRLKQTAEKSIPEPFQWTLDLNQLQNHFDSFLKSLVTSSSPDYDLQFQKECRETCKHKIDALCKVTNFSSSVVNNYSQQMQNELDKVVCVAIESEFTQLHEQALSSVIGSYRKTADLQKLTWSCLDNLTKSIILDYEKKFREENHRIRTEEAKIAQSAMDFALTKYNQFMDKATSQGSGIFTKSEISEFHTDAYNKIKTCFHSIPHFTFTMSWESSWKKLDKKLIEEEKDYLKKNAEKIAKNALQRKNSFSVAQNEYRRLMNGAIFTHGHGKSLSQDTLDTFHRIAEEAALKLYETKMKDVKEDTNKFKDPLLKTFLKLREDLMSENDEKLARELKEEEVAKFKKDERLKIKIDSSARLEKQPQQQQQNPQAEMSTSPTKSNLENINLDQNKPSFEGGVAIHFNDSGVSVLCYQKDLECTIIFHHLPPYVAFTPEDILIGEEAKTFNGKHTDHTIQNVFELLQSGRNDALKHTIHNKVEFLRTEEVFSIFLYKLSLKISKVLLDFHPSSCHVEFVISPFLHLPVKHLIKNALNLAGFSKAHILQSTSAMALTHFYLNPDKLKQTDHPHCIVAIHSSATTFDIVLSGGSDHKVTSWRQTGLPFCQNPCKLRRVLNSTKNLIFGGENNDEILLREMINSVIKDRKLPEIHNVILVVGVPNTKPKMQKVVQDLFKCQVEVVDECEGILRGAAAFAAWKAELPTFSPEFKSEEICPYYLKARFALTMGGHIFHPLVERDEQCRQQTNFQLYTVPEIVFRHSNDFSLLEGNEKHCWKVADYGAGFTNKKTIVGKTLQFEISPEGLINVQWPSSSSSSLTQQLPIRCTTLWLNQNELESASKRLTKVFSLMLGSSVTSKFDSVTTPQSPSTSAASFFQSFLSASAKIMTHQGGDLTHGHANSQTWSQNQADGGGDREFDKARKDLESFAKEVKGRLDNSQSTSALVRGQIEDLLKEVEGVLSKSSGSEADLLKSYMQKLEIRAKRIK